MPPLLGLGPNHRHTQVARGTPHVTWPPRSHGSLEVKVPWGPRCVRGSKEGVPVTQTCALPCPPVGILVGILAPHSPGRCLALAHLACIPQRVTAASHPVCLPCSCCAGPWRSSWPALLGQHGQIVWGQPSPGGRRSTGVQP